MEYQIYGSVEGVLVRAGAIYQIRGSVTDKAIECSFPSGLLSAARDALGKRVYAFGLGSRHL